MQIKSNIICVQYFEYILPKFCVTSASKLSSLIWHHLCHLVCEEAIRLEKDHFTELSPTAISVLAGKDFDLIIGYRWKEIHAKSNSLAVAIYLCTCLLSLLPSLTLLLKELYCWKQKISKGKFSYCKWKLNVMLRCCVIFLNSSAPLAHFNNYPQTHKKACTIYSDRIIRKMRCTDFF